MNITKADVSQYSITGEFTIAASISADSDSKKAGESKNVYLQFILDNTLLSEVIAEALRNKRVTWQTGARKRYDSITQGSTVKIAFKGGELPESLEDQMARRMQSMTADEQQAFVAQLMARARAK